MHSQLAGVIYTRAVSTAHNRTFLRQTTLTDNAALDTVVTGAAADDVHDPPVVEANIHLGRQMSLPLRPSSASAPFPPYSLSSPAPPYNRSNPSLPKR